MDFSELPFIRAITVCHTENCDNKDIKIETDYGLPLDSDILTVICGPCGNYITDITTIGEKFNKSV